MRYCDLFETTAWYWVLIKDGFAKVLSEDDFATVHALEAAGWEVIWDSARNPEQGYARAASYGAFPEDDVYTPILMRAPQVLYRSVSMPELSDVLKSGLIVGRKSSFHGGGEHRPWVFFAAEMSPTVIYQGEDVGREASVALGQQAIHDKFATIQATLRTLWQQLATTIRQELEHQSQRNVRAGYPPIDMMAKQDLLAQVAKGNLSARQDLIQGLNKRALWPLLNAINAQQKRCDALQAQYLKRHRAKTNALAAGYRLKPYSSAVLRTKPIAGGLHYSEAHGQTAMPIDEYGFHSGQVKLSDIDRIFLIKAGAVVAEGDPAQIGKLLKAAHRTVQ